MDSSPGIPYSRLGRTNKDVLEDGSSRGVVVGAIVERLRLFMRTDAQVVRNLTAEEKVQQGFCDPVKIFIKQEPHKVQKIKDGKWRIISNVSIVDQVIERILYRAQNKLEISRWTTTPSKPGMGLHDEGLEQLYSEVQAQIRAGFRVAGSDISGWDWAVVGWMLFWDAEARCVLAGAGCDSLFWKLTYARTSCLALKVFQLSDGQLWAQTVEGVQASGSYNTSSTNSRIRVMMSWLLNVVWTIAMGDDNLETVLDSGEVPEYDSLGLPLKEYVISEDGTFEFCSMIFPASRKAYPVRPERLLYRYLSNSLSVRNERHELRAQLAMELRHSPRKDEFLNLVDSIAELESKCHKQ
jgi:hypothetical protein